MLLAGIARHGVRCFLPVFFVLGRRCVWFLLRVRLLTGFFCFWCVCLVFGCCFVFFFCHCRRARDALLFRVYIAREMEDHPRELDRLGRYVHKYKHKHTRIRSFIAQHDALTIITSLTLTLTLTLQATATQ